MKRHFLILVLVASLTLSAPVAAQETTTPTPTATPTGEQTTIQLSPTTRLSGWSYSNSTFSLTIVSKTPTRLTLTDAGALSDELTRSGGASSAKIPQRTVNVNRGETTVTIRAKKVDGESAITIAALSGDGLVLIRTGAMGGSRPPVDYGTAQALVGAAAVASALGTFWYVRRKREEKQVEVERVW